MWLDPTEATPQLQALQAALQEAFPKCDDLSTISDSFKPHLSVGQVGPQSQEAARMLQVSVFCKTSQGELLSAVGRVDYNEVSMTI